MNEEQIKGFIGSTIDGLLDSALTRLTNEQNALSERKDMLIQEIGDQGDDRINILQTEIDNLYVAIKVLKALLE